MYDLPCPTPAPAKIFISPLSYWQQRIQIAPGLAVVIKIPPAKPKDETYSELICTEQDCANITELIKTMAENGKISLLFRQTHLRHIGAQINHVHPLKFLSIVFCNPELKICMKEIFEDYFKRTGFMDGLGASLSREMEKGKLDQYIEEFAKDVDVLKEEIRPCFQSGDWEALVRYLIGE
jgi:hypothetical protein